jgi:uncharacterized protein YbjQ (UPF0145 family)
MKWTCSSCSEEIEKDFDSCWSCGTGKDGSEPPANWVKEHPHSYPPMPDIACSTTPQIPGRTVDVSKGLVCGEAIMGANILRDLVAGITDIVGGRSGAYEGKLREGRAIAIREMMQEAENLGAHAVVGVDIDYETVAETMLMVSASGTAVLLKPANSIKNALNKKRW